MRGWKKFLIAGLLVFGVGCAGQGSLTADPVPTQEPEETQAPETQEQNQEETEMQNDIFYVTVNDQVFQAEFAQTVGAEGLKKLLQEGPVHLDLEDYGGFEKVGDLGERLPTQDVQTTTQAGDMVLYLGDQVVLFYGSNSWSYTRLGRVTDLTGWQEALGKGRVSVTLSLEDPAQE